VVIGGGIPPKILPLLAPPRLIERFTAKGRFAAWMRRLAVRVALEPRAALYGAAHHAATHKDARS
jgi:glucokinase